MQKDKSMAILQKCLSEIESMTPEDVVKREKELGLDPCVFPTKSTISWKDASQLIQEKFTSHNKYTITKISITEEEYLAFAGMKCKPGQVPKQLIISLFRRKAGKVS